MLISIKFIVNYQALQYIKWSTDCTITVKLNKLLTTLNCAKYSLAKAKLLMHSIL